METTLLATKLFIPRATTGMVVRPRLVQRLQGILNNRLTLVSAPAGFGKTTLLSQWIQDNKFPTTWLSLEGAENDPVRFWGYCIGALQKISPATGEKALSLLHSSPPIPIESTLNVLLNDITSIPEDFVLVLDDYYFIHSEAVHQGLTYFIEHLPPVMHLVIITRVDPPLPLARFRGKGSMLEIGTDDLRFNNSEAAGLFASLMGQALAAQDLEAINIRAEGWVVGLKMAALSLGKQKDIKISIAAFTGSQRYIMEYLVEEVLGYQSQDVRDFLLKTSVLTRMCGPLCDAVTQGTGGRERLLNLEKANLFLIPLDELREWYRYHHLFAELLRHQLDLDYGKDMAYELHKKASRWYEDKGLFEEAIDHALAARDWERAMVIMGYTQVYTRWVSTLTFLNWLRQIPEEILRSHTERYINYAHALWAAGQYAAAEECVNYLDTVAEHDRRLQGMIANVRAFIAGRVNDFSRAEEYARKALSLLDPDDIEQANAFIVLGSIYIMRGWLLEAEPLLKRVVELYQQANLTARAPFTYLGIVAAMRYKLNQAITFHRQAVEVAKGDPVTAETHLHLGYLYYYLNDLREAVLHARQAVDLFKLSGTPQLVSGYLFLAQISMAMGDREAALKSLGNADLIVSQGYIDPLTRTYSMAYHASIDLQDGDTESAIRWLKDVITLDLLSLMVPPPVVRLYWAQKGKATEAEYMQKIYEHHTQHGGQALIIAVRIIQALDSLGPENPLDCLSEALVMARPEGAVRLFTDFGMELVPLLHQAVSKGIEPEFARKLINIIESEDHQRKIRKGELPPSSISSAVLSEREMEVLHLMASGLSDRQISGKLVISLSTTKTHVHRILEKLNATSRMQAVTQAKELKLI